MASIRQPIRALLLLCLSVALTACSSAPAAPAPSTGAAPAPGAPKALDKMRYLTRSNQSDPLFTYWTVAEKMGFFKEEGIEDEVTHVDAGEQAIAAGQAELTVSAPNSMIGLLLQDPKIDLLSPFNQTPISHLMVVVLPDSPIKTVQDLKGKKVGVPSRGHSANPATAGIIGEAGLKPDDVQILVVPPGAAAVTALKKGDVDALCYHDTAVVQVEDLLGKNLRVVPMPPGFSHNGGPIMVGRKSDIEKNPDKYVRYIRGLLKGWVFVNTNIEAAARIQVKTFPELIAAGQTEADAIKTTQRALQARNDRQQLPAWAPPGSVYGETLEDNYTAWLNVIPEAKGKTVDWKKGFTNDLVKKAWQGWDQAKYKQIAKDYKG